MVLDPGPEQRHNEIVLFPFDDQAIPFQHGVKLQLNRFSRSVGPRSNIVLGLGEVGAPDDRIVTGYATVRRVGEELWMWYCAKNSSDDLESERLCFVVSHDGREWERPSLGLVEFNGNRKNNLVDIDVDDHIQACVVYHEPDDLPERRFKMCFESRKFDLGLSTAFSADGLHWTLHPNNPVGPWFEPAAGTRWGDCYVVNGQGKGHWSPKGWTRKLETHVSYDFETWSEASCLGLRRDQLPPNPTEYGKNAGKQVHLGASLWNRGNVLVGFYGMWNGHPTNDRRLTWMDLGLVVSHDGIHFREPVPDFPIVEASEAGWKELPHGDAVVHFPALIQSQGFANVGDETLFWYSPWPERDSDGIRLASWPRDRLGHFAANTARIKAPYVISRPIDLEGNPAKLFVNVDGVGTHARLTVSLMSRDFDPISGYGEADGGEISSPGLRRHVVFGSHETVSVNEPVRVKVSFAGVRPEDVRLYAIYVET